MNLSEGLRDSLKSHLSWGKPRLGCLVGMLLALLNARQMNLTLLAVHMDSDTEIASRYRRMQRFISQFGCKNILGVLADREFIGGLWWKWLSRFPT